MLTYNNVLLEMQMRRSSLEAEAQQARWSRLAAAGRSQHAKESGSRRMVVWLGDQFVSLGCRLQARSTAEPSATTCQ